MNRFNEKFQAEIKILHSLTMPSNSLLPGQHRGTPGPAEGSNSHRAQSKARAQLQQAAELHHVLYFEFLGRNWNSQLSWSWPK